MTPGALKVKQNKKSDYTLECLLGARSAQGVLQSDTAISFQGMVWDCRPSVITGNSPRSFREAGREGWVHKNFWSIHPSQRIKHPGRGTRHQAISRQLPVCIAITLLQKLDDFWNRVGGISGTQQVQQDFPPVFVIYYAGQGTDDFLCN